MDLVKLITEKVQQVQDSGKLEEIIEKNVIECLEDVVSDSFRWSGEAKKAIETGLKEKLAVDLSKIELPQYQKIVSGIVETQLNNAFVKDLTKSIEEAITSITGVLEKKEWKLSEIIEKFIESIDKSCDGSMDEQHESCSLHVDGNDKFIHVYFDMESGKGKYKCGNSLFIYDGKLSSATVDNNMFTPLYAKSKNGFDEFIFRLYCNAVTIIVDEYECELDYYREDYD